MHVKPPCVVEVVEIPAGSACTSPQMVKRRPFTQAEAGVREQLERFQVELEIAVTILPSTVRRIMASVPANRLPDTLRFVANKLYWRRRRESSYRRHVGWGFVLRVFGAGLRHAEPPNSNHRKAPRRAAGKLVGHHAPVDGFTAAPTPVSAPAWGSRPRRGDPERTGCGGGDRDHLKKAAKLIRLPVTSCDPDFKGNEPPGF